MAQSRVGTSDTGGTPQASSSSPLGVDMNRHQSPLNRYPLRYLAEMSGQMQIRVQSAEMSRRGRSANIRRRLRPPCDTIRSARVVRHSERASTDTPLALGPNGTSFRDAAWEHGRRVAQRSNGSRLAACVRYGSRNAG
jgi:hypothetical protein